MSPETVEKPKNNDRSQWVFPDNYLDDMVAKYITLVGASTDVTRLTVTEPVRLHIIGIYPELSSENVAKLTSIFLREVRSRRKSTGRRAGVMPLSSHRVAKRGGKRGN